MFEPVFVALLVVGAFGFGFLVGVVLLTRKLERIHIELESETRRLRGVIEDQRSRFEKRFENENWLRRQERRG